MPDSSDTLCYSDSEMLAYNAQKHEHFWRSQSFNILHEGREGRDMNPWIAVRYVIEIWHHVTSNFHWIYPNIPSPIGTICAQVSKLGS